MKRIVNIALTFVLSLSLFTSWTVQAEENNEMNRTLTEWAQCVMSEDGTKVLNASNKEVTSEFLSWYSLDKSESEIFDYLDHNDWSFYKVGENDNNKLMRSFSSKSSYQVFTDSMYVTLIADQPCTAKFATTVSGTISYNDSTYDVVSVYGASISTKYVGDLPSFITFYADGYSTSTSISANKTYGYVTGNVSLYATSYPDNPLASKTVKLKNASHTLSIKA